MARKTKDAPGRVTPKGGPPKKGSGQPAVTPAQLSGRYTAPIPRELRTSAAWVPYSILAFFVLGLFCIVLNYISVWPGSPSNWYLVGGLGLIVAGFIAATRWH